MRIVQISDLHLGMAGEETFEVDVRANFVKACQEIRKLAPDYVVVSGDLCYQDPHPEIYSWARQQLEYLDITYDLLSGNHDDPRMMAQIFEREHLLVDGALYYQRQLEGSPYLFLDTTTGLVGVEQLKWLAEALKKEVGPLIVFMHHPPLLAGVPHMDHNYAMQNRDEVLNLFLDYPDRVDIFCGHYHVHRTISCQNVNVHITPSCFFQMDPFSENFAVDHRRPGFRVININKEFLIHNVIYF